MRCILYMGQTKNGKQKRCSSKATVCTNGMANKNILRVCKVNTVIVHLQGIRLHLDFSSKKIFNCICVKYSDGSFNIGTMDKFSETIPFQIFLHFMCFF